MKATLSKDGSLRFTVSFKRRVGLEDMIDSLGWQLIRSSVNWHTVDDKAAAVATELKNYHSRGKIVAAVKEAVSREGDSLWTWADDCSFSAIVREQAQALILKKFPELQPSATTPA